MDGESKVRTGSLYNSQGSLSSHACFSLNYASRNLIYKDNHFFPEPPQLNFFSVLNSFLLVLILTAVLGVTLTRVLRSDYSRYLTDEDDRALSLDSLSLMLT